MTKNIKPILLKLLIIFVALPPYFSHAQSPQETLSQYISDLQKNPNDYAIRVKIIKHVLTMSPAPAVPEEARRHYVMARTQFGDAKNAQEYGSAIDEFNSALLVAPWWQEAYLKLSIALKAAGRYDEAIAATRLFIATNPGEEMARKAQDEIYILEAKQKKTLSDKAKLPPQAVAARELSKYEDWLSKINGRRYRETRGGPAVLEVRGKFLVMTGPVSSDGREGAIGSWEIRERIASTPRVMQPPPLPMQTTYTISEDGYRIIEHRDFSDGDTREFVWLWQR
ncbi:MAG: hypothetical protein V1753_02880 [Pseudomonadota bacterium]